MFLEHVVPSHVGWPLTCSLVLSSKNTSCLYYTWWRECKFLFIPQTLASTSSKDRYDFTINVKIPQEIMTDVGFKIRRILPIKIMIPPKHKTSDQTGELTQFFSSTPSYAQEEPWHLFRRFEETPAAKVCQAIRHIMSIHSLTIYVYTPSTHPKVNMIPGKWWLEEYFLFGMCQPSLSFFSSSFSSHHFDWSSAYLYQTSIWMTFIIFSANISATCNFHEYLQQSPPHLNKGQYLTNPNNALTGHFLRIAIDFNMVWSSHSEMGGI